MAEPHAIDVSYHRNRDGMWIAVMRWTDSEELRPYVVPRQREERIHTGANRLSVAMHYVVLLIEQREPRAATVLPPDFVGVEV